MKQNSLVLSILFVVGCLDRKTFKKIITSDYKIKIVHSIRAMEEILNNQSPDLIVLDSDLVKTLFDKDIVKTAALERMIPIVMLVETQREAIKVLPLGISDFFIKPVIPELLRNRIEVYMKAAIDLKLSTKMNITIHDQLKKKSEELIKLQSDIINVLSEAIEFRDFNTETHSLRTKAYVEIMIRTMLEVPNEYQKEISLWDIENHVLSSQLHDIGKIGIPDDILLKTDQLTEEEFEIIKQHVIIGERIIDKILKRSGKNEYLEIARKYISGHHEYWNGKGYPRQLVGLNISLEGRIMAVVDVYDAITSARPYKNQGSHNTAVATIKALAGVQFDPEIVRIFSMIAPRFRDMFKEK